jgi:hypothetical protein
MLNKVCRVVIQAYRAGIENPTAYQGTAGHSTVMMFLDDTDRP